jgi:hypothetical protein
MLDTDYYRGAAAHPALDTCLSAAHAASSTLNNAARRA